jgi:hypothetical protein
MSTQRCRGVWLRIGGRLADPKEVSVVEVTSRGTGVSPVVNPANGGMEHLHGQDAHATKIQPHPCREFPQTPHSGG